MKYTMKKNHIQTTHIYKFLKNKYFKQPLLELGTGRFPEKSDVGIDLNDNTANKVTNLIKHDLNKDPYPLKRKFKTIICMRVIEFIKQPKVLVSEAYRLLSDDGIFIISMQDNLIGRKNWALNNGIEYGDIFSPELENMLEDQGFTVDKYHNSFFNLNSWQFVWQFFNHSIYYYVCRKNEI